MGGGFKKVGEGDVAEATRGRGIETAHMNLKIVLRVLSE
jgi:hypothetical protein